jgi:hypothetical protein
MIAVAAQDDPKAAEFCADVVSAEAFPLAFLGCLVVLIAGGAVLLQNEPLIDDNVAREFVPHSESLRGETHESETDRDSID